MPVTKLRPGASTTATKITPGASRKSQPGISAFTRIIKPRVSNAFHGDQKEAQGSLATENSAEPSISQVSGESHKSKRGSSDGKPTATVKRQKSTHPQQLVTPKRPSQNPQCLPTPDRTPRQTLQHDTAILTTPIKRPQRQDVAYGTPPATSSSQSTAVHGHSKLAEDLPDELYDLMDLHAAFLKSLSLHFAHHGTASPVDINNLAPSVSKTWGRRKVTLDDIRQSLGILQLSSNTTVNPDLHLFDYGSGRICLELSSALFNNAVFARPINEDKLNTLFEANLRSLWSNHHKSSGSKQDTRAFLVSLPRAETPPHASTKSSKTASRTLLGQKRLTDLTGFVKTKSASPAAVVKSPIEPCSKKEKPALKSRTSDLLARLKAKSEKRPNLDAAQSQAAATSAAAKATRRAALQRLPEVVSILSLLGSGPSISIDHDASTSSNTRQTHSLATLVQTIRESARGVIGAEEAEQCLEVLSEETDGNGVAIAGKGFVRIVRIGGGSGTVVGVVVDVGKRAALGVVRDRVDALLASKGEAV